MLLDNSRDQLPGGAFLSEQAERRRRFVLMLIVRATVVTALLGSTIFFNIQRGSPHLSGTQILLYAVVAFVYLLTLGYFIWLRLDYNCTTIIGDHYG